MSHRATQWAIEQRGLKPAAKIVLWHLADRHNPDFGCFPSQERLAVDCEMSRSAVNEHLNRLEEARLIRRERRHQAGTRRRQTTRYILSFEDDFDAPADGPSDAAEPPQPGVAACPEAEPCLESGHGKTAPKTAEPCPDSGESHVRILPKAMSSSPDIEPVREPLREPSVFAASGTQVEAMLDRFLSVYPRNRSSCRERCRELIGKAIAQGVAIDWIIAAAERYRADNAGNKPMYLAYADNWLENRRWEDYPPPSLGLSEPAQKEVQVAQFWAAKIRAAKYVPPTALSETLVACMLSNGLVTTRELRGIGVAV